MDEQIKQEIDALRQQTAAAQLPPNLQEKIDRMFTELERSIHSANYFETSERIRHYIDWVIKIPWHKTATDSLDLGNARKILDDHHYGIEDMKTRILEYLSVLKLGEQRNVTIGLRAPVLLLVGQAGTGKTTFAKAIAEAMRRANQVEIQVILKAPTNFCGLGCGCYI